MVTTIIVASFLIVWMFLVSHRADKAYRAVQVMDSNTRTIGEWGDRIGRGVTNLERSVSTIFGKMTNVESQIQSVRDSSRDNIRNLKRVVGDVNPEWSVINTNAETGCDIPNVPSIAERIDALEDFLGLSFKHQIDEYRGYVPSNPDPKMFLEVETDVPVAEYPLKKSKSKK